MVLAINWMSIIDANNQITTTLLSNNTAADLRFPQPISKWLYFLQKQATTQSLKTTANCDLWL